MLGNLSYFVADRDSNHPVLPYKKPHTPKMKSADIIGFWEFEINIGEEGEALQALEFKEDRTWISYEAYYEPTWKKSHVVIKEAGNWRIQEGLIHRDIEDKGKEKPFGTIQMVNTKGYEINLTGQIWKADEENARLRKSSLEEYPAHAYETHTENKESKKNALIAFGIAILSVSVIILLKIK